VRTVNFLRFGRLGLYYMTLDGMGIGVWDSQDDRWTELDALGSERAPTDER
jgi:hypothetical protein